MSGESWFFVENEGSPSIDTVIPKVTKKRLAKGLLGVLYNTYGRN